MSRSLRIAHLPPTHPRIRFSGYLTSPTTSDAAVLDALSPFLTDVVLWRSSTKLPQDWLVRDDDMIQDPPPGVVPIWGEGNDVSAAATIGEPETPWRLLVGSGQLVFADVWLYDAAADPWPDGLTPCPKPPACPPCLKESVRAPTAGYSRAPAAAVGAALGVAVTAAVVWWRSR